MRRNDSTKRQRRDAPLATLTDLTRSASKDIAGAMNAFLAAADRDHGSACGLPLRRELSSNLTMRIDHVLGRRMSPCR
jgi:hypothetical protein